jgi:hypothetical protein
VNSPSSRRHPPSTCGHGEYATPHGHRAGRGHPYVECGARRTDHVPGCRHQRYRVPHPVHPPVRVAPHRLQPRGPALHQTRLCRCVPVGLAVREGHEADDPTVQPGTVAGRRERAVIEQPSPLHVELGVPAPREIDVRREQGGLAVVLGGYALHADAVGTEPVQRPYDTPGIRGPRRDPGAAAQEGGGHPRGQPEQGPRQREGERAAAGPSASAGRQQGRQQHGRCEQQREPLHVGADRRGDQIRQHDSDGVHGAAQPQRPPPAWRQQGDGRTQQEGPQDAPRRHRLLTVEGEQHGSRGHHGERRHGQRGTPAPVTQEDVGRAGRDQEQPRHRARRRGQQRLPRREDRPPLPHQQYTGGECEGDAEREGRERQLLFGSQALTRPWSDSRMIPPL